MSDCDHKGKWKATRDWMGDLSIPRGTISWTVWTCRKCGDETTEQPADWTDPRELDGDYLHDKAKDDALTGDA